MFTLIFLILFLIVFLLLLPFILLGQYVFESFVLWRFVKQTEACKPGYAWIPVVRAWAWGKCAEACEQECGDKVHEWGKYMLICNIANVAAGIVLVPIGIILSIFGGGFLLHAVSWVAIVYTVLSLICTFKIYRYYLGDPVDIILTLAHTQFGFRLLGLLIVSFIEPRGRKNRPYTAEYAEHEDGVVIEAEES